MEKPPCFGLVWEAFGTSECVRCAVREACLSETARSAYPESRARILLGGEDPTVQNLSRDMGISEEAVAAVQAHASRMPVSLQSAVADVKVGDVLQVVQKSEAPTPAFEEVVAVGLGPELSTPLSRRANPEAAPKSRKKLVRPRGEPTPKLSKLDMRKKEKRKKQGALASAPIPPQAGAAKSAAAPASGVALKAERAQTLAAVAAAAANSPPSRQKKKREQKLSEREKYQWRNTTDRFTREREKHPLIAALTPGIKLRRRSRKTGKVHELTVGNGYYEMKGVHYKTLQQATNAAAGTNYYPKQMRNGVRPKGSRRMCDWGAVRFWKLEALFKIHAVPPKEPIPTP